MRSPAVLRPVRAADAETVWRLLAPSTPELIGMASLPRSPDAAEEVCRESGRTLADLAAGSFGIGPGSSRRLLFLAQQQAEPGGHTLGLTGVTFKQDYPNLAVEVSTSRDGQGLVMVSSSAPWTRTELDSTFLAPAARGQGVGTLMSRGRFLFLHLVASQVPTAVASHLRGRFDTDGSAPFWRCFGAHLAPWPTSVEAESALAADPALLDSLAGHRRPVTAEVLDSLGAVNAASLPAYHLLQAEGMRPNGMYDPIDGGPTVVADIGDTASGRLRRHGRARVGRPGPAIDALVSVAGIDRFRALRTEAATDSGEATITIEGPEAGALAVDHDGLLVAAPLGGGDGRRPEHGHRREREHGKGHRQGGQR